MLFSTTEFLFVFLPITVAGFAFCAATFSLRAGTVWLTAASLFFYAYWDVSLLPLIVLSILVNFAFGKLLFVNRSKALLAAGLCFNLGLLGYFKYAGFFVNNVEALLGVEITELKIVLPLAISFFTFQQVAYLVDVYKRRAIEPDFLNFCLFVSFFPQLISGPIVHHSEMMPQFRDSARSWLSRKLVPVALAFIAIGLYKKVVLANGLSPIADNVFLTAETGVPLFWDAWIGALAYTFQIYFDFSGYTDMAIGIALLFGIRLPMNFNSPYKATNIIDFWRRWHMTLSRFIRDYIYIPLGGSRNGKSRRYINLMLAMLIGGFWHGAGWTFIIWGGLHGVYLIVNHGWRRFGPTRRRDSSSISRWTGRILTFFAVVVAWVFFRATDVDSALNILAGMAGHTGIGSGGAGTQIMAMLVAMLAIVWFTPNSCEMFRFAKPVIFPDKNGAESASDPRGATEFLSPAIGVLRSRTYVLTPLVVILGLVSLLIVIDGSGQTQKFIYMIF